MTNDETCTCYPVPEHLHTTHYGATDPASTLEPNTECPVHFPEGEQLVVQFAPWGSPPPNTVEAATVGAPISFRIGDPIEVASIDEYPLRDEVIGRAGQRGTLVGPVYVPLTGYPAPELGVLLRFEDGEQVAFLGSELVLPGEARR